MIFRAQLAVGALLFFHSIALGSNFVRASEEANSLEDERELMPFGWGQGYGYSTNNNRFSTARTRGNQLGSKLLRPYKPPETKAYEGDRNRPRPGSSKSTKNGNGKTGKAYKSAKYVSATGPGQGHNPGARPQRGGSYLNAMQWQRVPGQPIFVSNADTSIVILDEEPIIVYDAFGNPILVDDNGNEIIVTTDPEGNPTVEVIGGPTTSAPTATSTGTPAPTVAATTAAPTDAEGRLLRGKNSVEDQTPEGEDRKLLFGWNGGQGFGYSTNNNRFSTARTRGNQLGSKLLRPYSPPETTAYEGDRNRPRPGSPKSSKNGKGQGKAGRGKTAKYVSATGPGQDHNPGARPQRGGRSYLNAMRWQRVPGQPIFVSNTETSIVILDEEPTIEYDAFGNPILVNSNGLEIVVTVDAEGNPTVDVIGGPTTSAPSATSTGTPAPTVAATTEAPTAASER